MKKIDIKNIIGIIIVLVFIVLAALIVYDSTSQGYKLDKSRVVVPVGFTCESYKDNVTNYDFLNITGNQQNIIAGYYKDTKIETVLSDYKTAMSQFNVTLEESSLDVDGKPVKKTKLNSSNITTYWFVNNNEVLYYQVNQPTENTEATVTELIRNTHSNLLNSIL